MSLTQYADDIPMLGLRINGVADANVATLANVINEGAGWGLPTSPSTPREATCLSALPLGTGD